MAVLYLIDFVIALFALDLTIQAEGAVNQDFSLASYVSSFVTAPVKKNVW